MSQAVVKASSTAWVDQLSQGSAYPRAGYLAVTEAAGKAARAFVYCTVPVPHGATVSSATLTMYLRGPSSGWGTISVYACTNRVADSAKTWKHQPTIGAAQATFTPSGTQPNVTAVTFNVTTLVQQWANGGLPNYGLELRNSGSSRQVFYSALSAHPPTLTISYTTAPDTPHNLMPNGAIGVAKPVLQFGPYGDADGDALSAVRVQVATGATSFSAPTFDSGWVTATAPELDLSTTSFAGFDGTVQYWRVQVQDSTGTISAWSDPASCTVTSRPTVTLSSPSASSPVVTEATPQIVWSAPGMTSWRADILDAATNAIVADSGHQLGTIGQWGVPSGAIQPGGSYIVEVNVWDASRSPSPGDPSSTYASQAFTFVPGATPVPTAVTVTAGADWPGQLIVGCNASTAPDYFTIYMDGKVILAQQSPGAALVSGSTYAFTVDNAPTGTHTFQIDAVTAGVASSPSAVVQYNNVISGIWLGDPARKIWAMISSGSDTSVEGMRMSDVATFVQPIDGTTPQVVIRGMNGLSTNGGSPLTGFLSPKGPRALSVEQRAANLMKLKGSPRSTLRLVMGPYNIPVKVWNLSVGPSVNHSSGASWRKVQFEFFQCGEYQFEATL